MFGHARGRTRRRTRRDGREDKRASGARRSELPHSYAPMEATLVATLPAEGDWQYEPKWDGFRCLVFRDDGRPDLRSKAGRPLGRYFPDIVDAVRALPAGSAVFDSELVVPTSQGLSFDDLLQRIHPAASRVTKLAAQHPAVCIVFDLLADPRGNPLVHLPLRERRARLERLANKMLTSMPAMPGDQRGATVVLSPVTWNSDTAETWFKRGTSGWGGLDGVMAKARGLPYQSGNRNGMQKVKHLRTADCVVGGFRYALKGRVVGSLLLGLYDAGGLLHHVGFTSAMTADVRAALTPRLARLIKPPGFTGRTPGGPSRWSTRRTDQWEPLAPKLVVEVHYDHFSDGRFRHGTSLVRWRPDKAARQCTLDQIEPSGRSAMALLERSHVSEESAIDRSRGRR